MSVPDQVKIMDLISQKRSLKMTKGEAGDVTAHDVITTTGNFGSLLQSEH